jgi:hypothetical protein
VRTRSLIARLSWLFPRRGGGGAANERARQVIAQTDLFDREWYLQRYPDVANAAQDPLDHFIQHGGAEGRSPGPRFDAKWYLQRNADVARTGVNPLLHYLEHGRSEGRSIKPLAPRPGDDADLISPDRGGTAARQPAASPFPSEYDTTWHASPQEWPALLAQQGQDVDRAIADPSHPALLLNAAAAGPARDRIGLFVMLEQDGAMVPKPQNPEIAAVGLGLEPITDGWFGHARQLLLRMGADVAGASRIIGFQYGTSGAPHLVADEVAPRVPGLVRLHLQCPLGPVLLAWLAPDGTLLHAALIVFPSLYRGGLHHAEAMAVGVLRDESDPVTGYMAELAAELFGTDPPLLGRVSVQMRGANGAEAIFQSAVAVGLQRHFKVEIVASTPTDIPLPSAESLSGIFPDSPILLRRRGASELLLPPDMVPTLAALCSSAKSGRVGAGTFCIVPRGDPAEAVLACLPHPDAVTMRLAHPALPTAQPLWLPGPTSEPLRQSGMPCAIRTMNFQVWQVDQLLPLSFDIVVPDAHAGDDALPTISVLLRHDGTATELDLSLRAIAAQTDVHILGIEVVSHQPGVALPTGANGSNNVTILAEGTVAGSDRWEPSSHLVLLDTAVLAHDSRTFAILAGLCRAGGIGAATCALVASSSEDGAEESAVISWVPDLTTPVPASADRIMPRLFPGATFAVAAGDPRLTVVRTEIWQTFCAEQVVPQDPVELALALARHGTSRGTKTVATTLVRAAISRIDPSLPALPEALLSAFADGTARESAAHLIRLMP